MDPDLDPDPEAQKHVDPGDLDPDSDPDPQHCSYSRGYKNRAICGYFCVTSTDEKKCFATKISYFLNRLWSKLI